MMNNITLCAHCKEPIEGKRVEKGGMVYCSDACAYEATVRSKPVMCGRLLEVPAVPQSRSEGQIEPVGNSRGGA